MIKKSQITGIILCGGQSKRMGKNKALLKLGLYNLLDLSILALKNVCENIIISTNSPLNCNKNYKCIKDKFNDIGPISGIYSSLHESTTEHNIIISCDSPFISKEVLEYMIENSFGFDLVLPEFEGNIQSLTGYFNKSILPIIECEIEKEHYKPIQMFKRMNLNILKIDKSLSFYKDYLFLNINTTADYEEACRIYSNISS